MRSRFLCSEKVASRPPENKVASTTKSLAHPMLRRKRGQVTVFIIVAILIFVGGMLYFFVADSGSVDIPASFQPAYTSFLTCIEDNALTGIALLESQAGYIYAPDFEAGSDARPFSSELVFAGVQVPYWYYVSGSNVEKEQVPTKREMEEQLEMFVSDRISGCDLDSYYDQGFEISWVNPAARVEIGGSDVVVNLEMDLSFEKGEESILVRNHKVNVDSQLGSLYDSAVKVYDESREEKVLERYAVDVLRLYAPVDGVEITCAPKTWEAYDVFEELKEGIEANTMALNSGESVDEYFVVDLPVSEEVRFLNSRDWPYSFEVNPSEGSLLVANPVGNQKGLGMLGFCYAPYHFVYDVNYPVLVQVYSDSSDADAEIFQFPMAVVLENNNPVASLNVTAPSEVDPELCEHKNAAVDVVVVGRDGRAVQADVSYECSDNSCYIGQTSGGFLPAMMPECVNGFVTARADGYKDASYLLSSVTESSIQVVMDKIYTKEVRVTLHGAEYGGEAVVSFTSDDYTQTIWYPDQRVVDLAPGQYEIQVHVYKNSSITLGESVEEQCVEVPRASFLGYIGLTKERCFEVEIPEQVVSQALIGGGTQSQYILESELQSSSVLLVGADEFLTPETLEDLNMNYMMFDERGLEISFI